MNKACLQASTLISSEAGALISLLPSPLSITYSGYFKDWVRIPVCEDESEEFCQRLKQEELPIWLLCPAQVLQTEFIPPLGNLKVSGVLYLRITSWWGKAQHISSVPKWPCPNYRHCSGERVTTELDKPA
jgi:hypothetical protein